MINLPVQTASNFGIEEVAAIIGGLYIIARVIVLITPTPRDDEALKKVGKWLKALRVIIGLDLKQGIEKYSPK